VSKVQRPIGLDERDRKRPVVRADIQLCVSGRFEVDRVLLVVEIDETFVELLVGVSVAGIDYTVALRPQDSGQIGFLALAQGGDECGHGFLRRRKATLWFGRVRGRRLRDAEPEHRRRDRARPSVRHYHRRSPNADHRHAPRRPVRRRPVRR
jgi:hypothetical protein